MTHDELIADTNRLLAQIVQMDTERQAQAKKSEAEMEERMAAMKAKREEAMKTRMEERGLTGEAASASDEDWEARITQSRRQTEQNLEFMREKDREYKEQLIQELRVQSDLLRQIAEKLGR